MRGDAVAVVEAAYSFASDDRAWLAAVSAAARPLLDAGLGLISYAYDMRRASEDWLDPPVTIGADPAIARAIFHVHRQRPEAERVRPYLDREPARTASEIFAGANARAPRDAGQREAVRLGFADLLRIKAEVRGRFGCILSAPLPRLTSLTRTHRARWALISAHVAAALGLRATLTPASAVLDARGRAVHAARGVTRTALDELRRIAHEIDRARGPLRRRDPDRALAVWTALLRGEWSLVDRHDADGRRFWIARRNARRARDPRGLTTRERCIAELVARGWGNKEVGFELGLAEGTVAAHVASIKRKVSAGSRATLVSTLGAPIAATMTSWTLDRNALVVIAEEPRAIMQGAPLTIAERDVATRAVEGASSAEIANARGTSIHTVVNQLREAYRKLGVHSRAELGARLVASRP